MACPLTATGKISPIITQEMGPKLICGRRGSHQLKSLLSESKMLVSLINAVIA